MFNRCPVVVQLSETQSDHKNAPWLQTHSGFAPITLPLDGETEAALWPLVCMWIYNLRLVVRGGFKREKGTSF